MASLSANALSGGGGGGGGWGVKTKLKFDQKSYSVEKFAAAVKEHGAALREIDLGG